MLGAGTVLAALFVWRELRFNPPFLDLRLLGRNRPLMLVYLGFAVFSSVYYFVFFGLPQLLQEAGGYDPGAGGAADAAAGRDVRAGHAVGCPGHGKIRRPARADCRRRTSHRWWPR